MTSATAEAMQGRTRWAFRLLLLCLALPVLCYVALRVNLGVFGAIRAGGVRVERGESGVRALTAHAEAWGNTPVSIRIGPYVERATRKDLGAQLSIAAARQRLLGLGHDPNPFADLAALWASRLGGLDLSLQPEISRAVLSERISNYRRRFERAPVPGTVLPDGQLLAGIPGVTINSLTALDQLERGLASGAVRLQVDTKVVPAPRPVAYGAALATGEGQFGQAMSLVETRYRETGAAAGRAHNIELAADAINGAVIKPGGELSFNETVGERSWKRGFETAKEIANRRVVDGIGGGVCQVAATLHAAAFLSGLGLPEYRPHSRPALYIELGLDTMVSWPSQDMRIANPYPFAVRVRAHANDGVLRVQLDGAAKPHVVEWSTEILQRTAAGTRRVVDASLPPGRSEVVQEAVEGLLVRRTRTVFTPSGPQTERKLLTYPPNDRIVAVGPGSSHGETNTAVVSSRVTAADF